MREGVAAVDLKVKLVQEGKKCRLCFQKVADLLLEGRLFLAFETETQSETVRFLEKDRDNYWFVDGDIEYFDRAYLDMNPLYRTDYAVAGLDNTMTNEEIEYMTEQEKFAPAVLVNISVGKSWFIQRKYQLGFSFNGKNLLNNRSVKTGGYEQTRLVDNTVSKERFYRFDPKYFYMAGTNYMLNVYFRF